MYVEYGEYKALGFRAVGEADFPRYEMKAEGIVRRFTFDRIADANLRPPEAAGEEVKRTAEMNMRGVCEIIDACYARDRAAGGTDGSAVKSFSNEGYSETYEDTENRNKATTELICTYIDEYFTPQQRYRGV
jgi:hypothetical protein